MYKIIAIFFSILFICALLAPEKDSEYEKQENYYTKLGLQYLAGEQGALDSILKDAHSGNMYAQHRYALLVNTKDKLKKSFVYEKKAAEQGHKEAMFNLAYDYENGMGVEQNIIKAFRWYLESSRKGYKLAELQVDRMLGKDISNSYKVEIKRYPEYINEFHKILETTLE